MNRYATYPVRVFRQATVVLATLLLVVLCGLLFGESQAAAQNTATIAQGFKTDIPEKEIIAGSLVGKAQSASDTVELASLASVKRLTGVIDSKPLLAISNGSNQVQVVVSGATKVLVSDLNGAIYSGDKITASPINGIGMRALAAGEVIGSAQSDFKSIKTVKQSVAGLDGKQTEVNVGLLPVTVNVAYYTPSNGGQGIASSMVPAFLQALANSIAGQQVSPVRVLLSALVILLGFAVATILLYTSVRNSMISIGRNPMAEKMVRKGVREIVFVSIGILLLTAGIVYMIIKL